MYLSEQVVAYTCRMHGRRQLSPYFFPIGRLLPGGVPAIPAMLHFRFPAAAWKSGVREAGLATIFGTRQDVVEMTRPRLAGPCFGETAKRETGDGVEGGRTLTAAGDFGC